jgi:ligand-binding sensor domain-containing protein
MRFETTIVSVMILLRKRINKIFKAIFIVASMCIPLNGQILSWDNYPISNALNNMLIEDESITIASDGGLLTFDLNQNRYIVNDLTENIENPDINVVFRDKRQRLWLGNNREGNVVDVLNLGETRFYNSQLDVDGITHFVEKGDSIFASFFRDVEGGILYFQNNTSEIRYLDIFEIFPTGVEGLNSILDLYIIQNKLVFVTPSSVVWAELSSPNLKNPSNWSARDFPNLGTISACQREDGILIIAGEGRVYSFDFNIWTNLFAFEIETVTGLFPRNLLSNFVATDQGLYRYSLVELTLTKLNTLKNINDMQIVGSEVWITTESDFLVKYNDTLEYFKPNMPRNNYFLRMSALEKDRLLMSGRNGISIFEDNLWTNYVYASNSTSYYEIPEDLESQVNVIIPWPINTVAEDMIIDKKNQVWISFQGRGVFKVNASAISESKFFKPENSILAPTYDSQTYTLPGQLAEDARGNIWITSSHILEGDNVITVLVDDTLEYGVIQSNTTIDNRVLRAIAIDQNGRVWAGAKQIEGLGSGGGLYFMDFNSRTESYDEMNSRQWSALASDPLENNEILQLEVDQQNRLWILTPGGLQMMPVPSQWLSSNELLAYAKVNMRPLFWELLDYKLHAIEIDSRDNVWCLSSNLGFQIRQPNGVWLNGGYGYNTGNSPLVDDFIYSASFHESNGEAYLSTDKGIMVLQTAFATPKSDYSTINIFPQPYYLSKHSNLNIQGLMDNSTIRIFDINGKLIRELNAENGDINGFHANWDGKNLRGISVGSGVYLALLYDLEGNTKTIKIAVLQ